MKITIPTSRESFEVNGRYSSDAAVLRLSGHLGHEVVAQQGPHRFRTVRVAGMLASRRHDAVVRPSWPIHSGCPGRT